MRAAPASEVAQVDADAFRGVLGRFPAGVTVVTVDVDGQRKGMTASAFASVSLDPPLVLVCVDKGARTHDKVQGAGAFGVNILARDQKDRSDRFAGIVDEPAEPFEAYPVREGPTGSPLFEDALAVLDTEVHRAVDAGDHTIFVGRVLEADLQRPSAVPLVYEDRSYHQLAPLDASFREGDT